MSPKAALFDIRTHNPGVPRFYLTSAEVADAVARLDGEKLPIRTLAGWAARRVITPSVWRRVRRAPRLYTAADLAKTRFLVQLRRKGVSLLVAEQVLMRPDIQRALRPNTEAIVIVHGPRRVELHERPGAVGLEVLSGQSAFPLADVWRDTRETVRSIARERAA